MSMLTLITALGFGLPPSEDDPDPFGVHALEEQGMEVREAGTRTRPSGDAFEYKPSPTSPIFSTFHIRRNSKRDSGQVSIASAHTDRGTQTIDFDAPRATESPRDSGSHSPAKKTSENLAEEVEDGDSPNEIEEPEEPQEATVISRAKLVTIPKRIPPALPPRSPYRASQGGETATPASPVVTQHQDHGLGIDMNTTQNASNREEERPYPVPSNDSLDERLEQIHLVPSQDHDRLSPNKDGFDEVSMSGSDYSRGTPTEKPAEEPSESTIVMHDNEDSVQDKGAEKGSHIADDVRNTDDGTRPSSSLKQDSEAFHSVPGTPLEADARSVQTHPEVKPSEVVKEEGKIDDFS